MMKAFIFLKQDKTTPTAKPIPQKFRNLVVLIK